MAVRDRIDVLEQHRGPAQGIAPAFHRRRAGVGLGAGHRAIVPASTLCAGHDTDPLTLGFEDRALLDVQLEQRADRPLPDRQLARVADPPQLLADGPAGVVPAGEAVLEIEHAGEHARCDHRGRKAAAFLVGPVDHLERGPGPDAVVVQRAHHLEGGEHAERAVELAAGRLAVEVAAEHHGRLVGVRALAPREHAAHAIDADLQPGFLAPGAEQVAAAPVLIGQRLPVDPAGRRRADLGHGHQALPQPLAVHPDLGHRMPPHLPPRSRW